MRKRVVLFLFLLCVSLVSAYEYNITGPYFAGGQAPQLRFDNLKYEPYPVTPGDHFEVWLKITNIGEEEAPNAVFELVEEFPFSNYGTLDKKVEFPNLNPGASVVVKFDIYVNPDAVEKTTKLKISAKAGEGLFPVVHELPIDIKTRGALIAISSIEPESIIPGKKTKVKFTFANPTDSVIKEITIKPNFDNTPFTPINSIAERRIPVLKGSEEATLIYELIADPSYETKPYKIPITISYNDFNGRLINKSDIIGLLIKPDISYIIDVEETEVYSRGDVGSVVLSISNIGFSDMKFVSLELEDSEYYQVIEHPRIYLGNLDSDDFETAEFKIKVKKSGKIPLKLKVSYKDIYNNEQNEGEIVDLPIYSAGEAVSYGLITPKSSFANLVFYILIIMFIYSWWKEWRAQKDLGKGFKIVLRRWIINVYEFFKIKNLKQIPKKIKNYLRK